MIGAPLQAARTQALVVSEEVQAALQKSQAVVALESTIISHGMPYPQNFKTALEVEAVVRANGAIPATVAILAGVPHVGLSESQLHDIAQKGLKVQKTSRRDLAHVMTRKLDGSTTVSATMLLAAKAGIAVFVTGGTAVTGLIACMAILAGLLGFAALHEMQHCNTSCPCAFV